MDKLLTTDQMRELADATAGETMTDNERKPYATGYRHGHDDTIKTAEWHKLIAELEASVGGISIRATMNRAYEDGYFDALKEVHDDTMKMAEWHKLIAEAEDPPPEWIEAMAIAQATGGKTEWGQHDRDYIKEGFREDSRAAYRALRDKIMEKNDA